MTDCRQLNMVEDIYSIRGDCDGCPEKYCESRNHHKLAWFLCRNPNKPKRPGGQEILMASIQYPFFSEDDLKNVSEWLNRDLNEIKFEFINEDIDKFKKQITEMENSITFQIDDRDRVELIVDFLEDGNPPYAIFVDKKDNFILEGRHRIVAFHRFDLKIIPVYYVSIRKDETDK